MISVWTSEIFSFVSITTTHIYVYVVYLCYIIIICFISFSQGNDFTSYIEKRKPLVFTRESSNPYVCNNGGIMGNCKYRFSDALERSGIPEGVSGPSCDNVEECNDPKFGDI